MEARLELLEEAQNEAVGEEAEEEELWVRGSLHFLIELFHKVQIQLKRITH